MQFLPSFRPATKFALMLCVALTTVGAGRAQQTAPGVLGQRFADVNFDFVDLGGINKNGYSSGLSLNLPATPNLDVGLGYAYGWLNTTGTALHEHTFTTSANWHASAPGIKPAFGFGLGYDWTRNKFGALRVNDGAAIWGAGVAVEIPVGVASLTPSITFTDVFRSRSVGAMHYGVEANYWFTPAVAGYVNVTFTDFTGHHGSSWMYRTGLRFKF
jgi:hypothetical protein